MKNSEEKLEYKTIIIEIIVSIIMIAVSYLLIRNN